MTKLIEKKITKFYIRKGDDAKLDLIYFPKENRIELNAKENVGVELEGLLEDAGFTNQKETVERVRETPQISSSSYSGTNFIPGGH
jgi:hypothetical protein